MFALVKYRQNLDQTKLADVEAELEKQLAAIRSSLTFQAGQNVGIAVGSRGIANLDRIVSMVVRTTRSWGLEPFILPAMGSHGGATAEGQTTLLAGYGISEEKMGCPVVSSMEVVEVGRTERGTPVFLSQTALTADHIILINRIKPHTLFSGPIESGLLKMAVVGLGKHQGALAYHSEMKKQHPSMAIEEMARTVFQHCRVLFGIGLVENAYDQTARIQVMPVTEIFAQEKVLLEEAKRLMPRLPCPEFDLLIVDEMGKDISGSGMDPNIVGRYWDQPVSEPNIGRIFVRALSEKTHGNAIGIGRADFTTNRLVSNIDYQATYANSITSGNPVSARIPIHFETDKEVLEAVLQSLGSVEVENLTVVWIKNTLEISEILLSPSLIDRYNLDPGGIVGEPFQVEFDEQGNLLRPPFGFEST
ncbi:MAG: DUF2088 domain-containing protein [Firmicutes bacterium]|nr:DUF2088 domain-containing protein [Bacillota bacterium]